MEIQIEKVMDRTKIANSIHQILEVGTNLLTKEKLESSDFAKIKVIRTLGSHINAAISMVQQETAQQRAAIVIERMRQLGYGDNKQLT